MNFINLESTNKLDDFYKTSALTIVGILPKEAQSYVEYFKENNVNVDENIDGYIYTGALMNERYNLLDESAYPENIHFLTIPTKALFGLTDTARFGVGGLKFNDIVSDHY